MMYQTGGTAAPRPGKLWLTARRESAATPSTFREPRSSRIELAKAEAMARLRRAGTHPRSQNLGFEVDVKSLRTVRSSAVLPFQVIDRFRPANPQHANVEGRLRAVAP